MKFNSERMYKGIFKACMGFVGIAMVLLACEKDDICVEGDTPLLVIGFYDIADTTEFKTVPTMRIKALHSNTFAEDSILDSDSYTRSEFEFNDRTNVTDSIFIPLRVSASNTDFVFISSSADEDEVEIGNRDTLTFNYTVNQQFISRACGLVANFNELDTTRTVSDSDWIKRITVQETDVELSNTIHVKIFH